MKAINTATVQSIVITLAEGMAHADRGHAARVTVSQSLTDLRDASLAAQTVKAVMEQAILQGKADIVRNADGSRNDKASNWKRDLSKAYNTAYPDSTSLAIKTAGKGQGRTVSLSFAEKVEKSPREKFLARVAAICEEVNATQAEAASVTKNLVKLYDFEQEQQATVKAIAKQEAEKAMAENAKLVTARISDMLTAKGIEATPENIEIARLVANA